MLDGVARQLLRDGRPLHLTPKALELLVLLVESPGRALSKEEIHGGLWPCVHVSESNLPVVMHELREALGDDAHEPRWVRTLARFGYVFYGEVHADPDDPAAWECRWDCRVLWKGQAVLLRPGENVLGRSHEAAVWVDDPSVSRRHAVVRVSDAGATLGADRRAAKASDVDPSFRCRVAQSYATRTAPAARGLRPLDAVEVMAWVSPGWWPASCRTPSKQIRGVDAALCYAPPGASRSTHAHG